MIRVIGWTRSGDRPAVTQMVGPSHKWFRFANNMGLAAKEWGQSARVQGTAPSTKTVACEGNWN